MMDESSLIDEEARKSTHPPTHSFQSQGAVTSAFADLEALPLWHLQLSTCSSSSSSCAEHGAHPPTLLPSEGGRDLDGDGLIAGFSSATTKMDLGQGKISRKLGK